MSQGQPHGPAMHGMFRHILNAPACSRCPSESLLWRCSLHGASLLNPYSAISLALGDSLSFFAFALSLPSTIQPHQAAPLESPLNAGSRDFENWKLLELDQPVRCHQRSGGQVYNILPNLEIMPSRATPQSTFCARGRELPCLTTLCAARFH